MAITKLHTRYCSAISHRFYRGNSGNGAQSFSGRPIQSSSSLEDDAVEDVEMKEEKKKLGIRCRVQFGQTFDREYLASSPCTSTVCGYLIEICIFMVSQYRQQSGSIDPILHALRQMNKYLVELVLE